VISDSAKQILLEVARQSIQYGLQHANPLPVEPGDYPEELQVQGASFVTLSLDQQLRGCIGSLEARRPLIVDVADNAFAAAFRDPRFPPLSEAEFPDLDYHISILTPPEPMQFSDEADLLAQIQPNIDGLVLEDRGHRGTFLPSVWESLPQPAEFLRHLKLKAGLPTDYWSDTLKVSRYRVQDVE